VPSSFFECPRISRTTKRERRNDDREMVSAAPFKLRSVASYKKSVETKRRESLAKTQAAATNSEWGRFYVQAWFCHLVSLLAWLFLGTLWCKLWHEWPFWTAFYYLMQATMSIGFGSPSQDDICYRDQDVASGSDVFKFSNAKYYVKGKQGICLPWYV